MSIIEQEAERLYPDLVFPGFPRDQKHFISAYTSDDLQEAYMQGADRKPTDAEVEAAAKACYEHYWADLMGDDTMRWPDDTSVSAQEIFRHIALVTLQAARLKSLEDHQ